jgi:hypothetical protein
MRILDPADTQLLGWWSFRDYFSSAAGTRVMNWAYLIATKPHGSLLVWFEMLEFASERKHGLHGARCEGAAGRAIDLRRSIVGAQEPAETRFLIAFCVPDVCLSRTVRWRTSLGQMQSALSDILGRHSRASPAFAGTPAKL